jgi:hypothetical protein
MALDGSPNFVVLTILGAGRDKAPVARKAKAQAHRLCTVH